jgi:hypothetical protein
MAMRNDRNEKKYGNKDGEREREEKTEKQCERLRDGNKFNRMC